MLIENIQRLDWKKIASLEPNILGKNFNQHEVNFFEEGGSIKRDQTDRLLYINDGQTDK